jgi:hypothetical protein
MPKADFTAWEHEPVSDAEIDRTAHLWLERHGAAAVATARARVAELRHKGDLAGADAWLRLIVAVEERTQGRRG